MFNRVLIPVGCSLLLATICFAEMKRIKLKNGKVFDGDIVKKTDKGIHVKRNLGEVFYPKEDIESIEAIFDPQVEYNQRLAKVGKTDADAHVALGQWAMTNKMYKEAVERFEAALAIEKGHERAPLLLRKAKALLAENPVQPGNGGTVVINPVGPSKVPIRPELLLTMEDIYRIRLEEVRKGDRVVVDFKNNVIERFIKDMRGTGDFEEQGFAARFRAVGRPKQVMYILEKADRADPIKDDIIVKNDPIFMRQFRTGVWRHLANSCAASTCHGGPTGKGKLKLYNIAGRSINVEYTNFLILDSFEKNGMPMIRRDGAEKSLLLEYGLPNDQAEFRHPKKALRPVPFSSRTSSAYKQTLAWIEGLKGPGHPDYRIKKLPPHVMTPSSGGLPAASGGPKGGSDPNTPGGKRIEPPF